jgi:hypothetical protein
MDKKLQQVLTECIRDIETGAADINGCLTRYPDRAGELRPHLEFWSELNATPKTHPSIATEQRGQRELLTALATEREQGKRATPFFAAGVARVAAVLGGVALLTAGAAGASAALGGPDFADQVLSTVGVASHNDGPVDSGLENARQHAADDADFGLDTAENATEKEHGADNAEKGLDTAEKATDDGLNVAGEHAANEAEDGLDTARDAKENAGGSVPEDVAPGPGEAPGPPGAP